MRLPRTIGGGNSPYIYCTLTFDIWRLPLPPGLACWALNPPIMLGTRSSDYHADVHEAVQRPHKLNCAAGDTTTEFPELCANMEFVKHFRRQISVEGFGPTPMRRHTMPIRVLSLGLMGSWML